MEKQYGRKLFYQDKEVAASYSEKRFSGGKGQREHQATVAALGSALETIPEARTLLDMPCGTGRFSALFHDRGYLCFGADVSMEMLEVLARDMRERGHVLPLVRCDAEELPFKDSVFDCIVCVRFLNLVPVSVRGKILSEMRRVSNGWLVVQSHHLKLGGALMRLKVRLRRLFGGDVGKYQLGGEILMAGWSEIARVPVKHTRHYVGVYRKISDSGSERR